MNNISPLATVSPNAKLGDNVTVGPGAYIDDNVVIGDNCRIHPNAVIYEYVTMGNNCQVFPGAVVGAIPQDLKFEGEVTYVEIGDNVTIRECATINRGTKASGKGITKVGSNTLVMSYVHIAHDCTVGEHCILVSHSAIAGETDIHDWAIMGGGSMAHQFTKVGAHAMVGGCSRLGKDVPPYALAGREPLAYCGVNVVGLRRRGFSSDTIRTISDIYNTIYNAGLNISDGCAKVEEGFPDSEEKKVILDFIRGSKRGIIKPRAAGSKDID